MFNNVASMDRVGARVVWLINARGDDFAFEVDDDRFNKFEIAQAIVETEFEIVQLLADIQHPHRTNFQLWLDVEHGEQVPKHLGRIEAVKSLSACGDDVMMEPTARSNIKFWKENHADIFSEEACGGDLAGYYNLTNDVITFTGDVAEALMVIYNPVYPDAGAGTYGELKLDAVWEGMLVDGAISRLAKIGVPSATVQHYANRFMSAIQSLKSGKMLMPPVDRVQIADARA
jgi:glycosyltransferase involved in cell wall biosynthesis